MTPPPDPAAALEPLLARLGIDSLQHPEWLPWLLLAGAAALFVGWRTQPASLGWPGTLETRAAGARRSERVRGLALGLRGGALACLALAWTGPVAIHRAPPEPGFGLDLVLAVDTSGSMRALDASEGSEARTRLDLARRVVSRFARHRVAEGDRVGLVVFGKSAFTQCPLTSDGTLLAASLERVEVGMAGEATALGDALALAVKRATGADGAGASGRVVVLLTDGRSNAGAIPVEVASQLAAGARVRVHTVGIGTGGESVAMAAEPGAAGAGLRFERHDPDHETLGRIARASGGRFYAVTRTNDLDDVYREIDSIERAPRPLPPRVRRNDRAEPLLAAAGIFLLVEIGAARIWRRTLP